MLEIIGTASLQEISLELDDYIPFKFKFCESGGAPHLYWRAGDLASTLLEVEVDRESGKINGGSLLLSGDVVEGLPQLSGLAKGVKGVPVVSIENWPESRYLDDGGEFQVFADSSNLLILFTASGDAEEYVEAGGLFFGLSKINSLAWILVKGLTPEKLDRILSH